MLYRKVFKIKNSDEHVIGLCWAVSAEEAKSEFCEKIAPPYELINKSWKTAGYFKVLEDNDLKVEEHRGYLITHSHNNKIYTFKFDDEIFNNTEVYERLNFKADESSLIKIIKLYKTGNKCSKEGEYLMFNDSNLKKPLRHDEGDEFGDSSGERAYFYYIEK